MKKKVLFVNYSLHSGGVEKSLVTLLSLFDYEEYDVSLQLFVAEGLFMNAVDKNVKILPPFFPPEYRLNIRKAFFSLLKQKKIRMAMKRLQITLTTRTGTLGDRFARAYKAERVFLVPKIKEQYDAVIAFMEGQPLYYVADKVDCSNKVGFIHGDYIAMGLDKDADLPYINKLNALCTVSSSCKDALDKVFPNNKSKHYVINNIISKKLILKLAQEKGFDDDFEGTKILSIARLSHQKGLDVGLEAVAKLKESGANFKWYIIGIGPEYDALLAKAKALKVADCVEFLGEQDNPYPYLNECDIYFQPSRFEGKAIAVDEAMVLQKPILLANFSTAKDQIDNGKNGMIAEFSAQGLCDGLIKMIADAKLRESFSDELKKAKITNETEIKKVYDIIEG